MKTIPFFKQRRAQPLLTEGSGPVWRARMLSSLCVLCLIGTAQAQSGFGFGTDAPAPPTPTPPPDPPIFRMLHYVTGAKEVLKRDPSQLNALNGRGETVLLAALDGDYDRMVALLLEKGADPNRPDKTGRLPLWVALQSQKNLIPMLLQHGANPNLPARGPLRVSMRPDTTFLMQMGAENNRELAALALQHGAKLETRDARGRTALAIATLYSRQARSNVTYVKQDDKAAQTNSVVELLISKGAQVNTRDNFGLTPLHITAFIDDAYDARLLLQHGANPNPALPISGDTPLHIAVRDTNEVVTVLLRGGANANTPNARGDFPLHLVLRDELRSYPVGIRAKDNEEFPDKLLVRNVMPRSGLSYWSNSFATSEAASLLAQTQLIAHTDLKARDWAGWTPQMRVLAGRMNQLRAPINAHHLQSDTLTQFIDAIAGDNIPEMTRLLARQPALAKARWVDGSTPLHLAALWESPQATTLLLRRGADANAHAVDGLTPLHQCALAATGTFASRATSVMATLLKYHAQVEARDLRNDTPLMSAVRMGQYALVKQLLNAKAQVRARGEKGQTALHLVSEVPSGLSTKVSSAVTYSSIAWEPDARIAALLVARGSEVNARDSNGITPLAQAVVEGHLGRIQVLLQAGADPNAPDAEGCTPMTRFATDFGAGSKYESWRTSFSFRGSRGYWTAPDVKAGETVLRALLRKGGDPNASASDYSVLSYLSNRQEPEKLWPIIKLLLESGADYKGSLSSSPLLYEAVKQNDQPKVALLLKGGAPVPSASNGWGGGVTNLLDFAKRNSTPAIVALLQARVDAQKALGGG